MPIYRPPAAFYFEVALLANDMSPAATDAAFEEVSGLQAELEFETVQEGGENRFSYRLPTRAKYPNLVLKRGMVVKGSALSKWASDTIGAVSSAPVKPRGLNVMLLSEKGQPLVTWTVYRAWPIRWQLANLSSKDNNVLTETLEFTYDYFQRKDQAAANWGMTD